MSLASRTPSVVCGARSELLCPTQGTTGTNLDAWRLRGWERLSSMRSRIASSTTLSETFRAANELRDVHALHTLSLGMDS